MSAIDRAVAERVAAENEWKLCLQLFPGGYHEADYYLYVRACLDASLRNVFQNAWKDGVVVRVSNEFSIGPNFVEIDAKASNEAIVEFLTTEH